MGAISAACRKVTYHAAVSGGFYLYSVNGKQVPQLIHDLFDHPRTIAPNSWASQGKDYSGQDERK